MSIEFESASRLAKLKSGIERKTGESYENLTEGVNALIAGYGSGGTVRSEDVNFYDYDGTLVYSYTLDEVKAMTELPAMPVHEGLTAQRWNYSLDALKKYTRAVDVGATYTTDDGTTRIYIRLEDSRTSPMLGVCPNGTVDVDWGDGTAHDTLAGTSTSAVKWTPTHEYASAGDYVIRLTVDGEMGFYGSSLTNQYSGILRYSSSADGRNYAYQNAVQRVEVGNGVTSIGSYAFYWCYSLANVVIPDGVTSIGDRAFYWCYSLASVVIPDGVTSLSSDVFYDCRSLTSVVIPDSVTSIGSSAFYDCRSLASVVIPDGVTSLSSDVFYDCYSLASVVIPDGVTSIGSYAFDDCYSLASVVIPDSVTSIGDYAFDNCYSLANVVIPDGVTSLGSHAFYGCYSLASVVIPDGVTSIGPSAFSNCRSLTSVVIPDGVTSINSYAFFACYSLVSVAAPANVTSIGSSAFQYCYSLKCCDFTKCTAVPTLANTNAFTSTPDDFEIRVPMALVDEWKSATNWATYASKIVGVEV